jgi:hypothetical protein
VTDSSSNLSNVFVSANLPTEWTAQNLQTGLAATGKTREEALSLFKIMWAHRAPVRIIDGPPPRPLRPGEAAPPPPQLIAARSARTVYRELLERHARNNADVEAYSQSACYPPRFTWEQMRDALTELMDATTGFAPPAVSTEPADEAVIECYRKWAKVFHPDVAGSINAHEAMMAITELFEAATKR